MGEPRIKHRAPKPKTRGRKALVALMQVMSTGEIAARCRVSESAVRRWASGCIPSPATALMLETHCRVPRSAWTEVVASPHAVRKV